MLDSPVGPVKSALRFKEDTKHHRKWLKIDSRFKLRGLIDTRRKARDAVILATFSDGTECQLNFDDVENKQAEYVLRLVDRAGKLKEKAGDCVASDGSPIAELPDISGGSVRLELDDDDDRDTPNRKLGEIDHF